MIGKALWDEGQFHLLVPWHLSADASSVRWATRNTLAPSSTWQQKKAKTTPNLHVAHRTGRKALSKGIMLSNKTTLIINPGNWNTLQDHCDKFNIYTKSGGWSSFYCREGKHEEPPERAAQFLPPPTPFICKSSILISQQRKLSCIKDKVSDQESAQAL